MSRQNETFFTSVGCMDGRVQTPVLVFGQKKFGVKFADTITEAGLMGLLARDADGELLKSLKSKILISLEKHHSKGIVVHGHEECAGNPVAQDQHKKDVRKAAQTIDALIQNNTQIISVFVKRNEKGWIARKL